MCRAEGCCSKARDGRRAWVRMVRGVNACSRHSRSARHVKGGWHKRAELEPASARAAVRALAALCGSARQQGACVVQRAVVQKRATGTFKEAPRAGPTGGRAHDVSRRDRKSLVLCHRGTGRLELGGGFSRFAEFSFSRLRFSDRPPVLPRGSARIGSGLATGARPGAALRNYSCLYYSYFPMARMM